MRHRVQGRTSYSHPATSTCTNNIGCHYLSSVSSNSGEEGIGTSFTATSSVCVLSRIGKSSASSSNISPVTSTASATYEKSFRMDLFVPGSGDPLSDEVANPPTTKSEIVTQINQAWTHYQKHKPSSIVKDPARIIEKMKRTLGHMGKRKNFAMSVLFLDFLWMCVFISYWITPCSGQGKDTNHIYLLAIYISVLIVIVMEFFTTDYVTSVQIRKAMLIDK